MTALSENFVKNIFSYLEQGEYHKFFEHVADDVHWHLTGTHPLAGVYRSKDNFFKSTFMRLRNVLHGEVVLKVLDTHVKENRAIVEMTSSATAKNGKTFHNTYCWIVKFENKIITSVKAYADSALLQSVINENE